MSNRCGSAPDQKKKKIVIKEGLRPVREIAEANYPGISLALVEEVTEDIADLFSGKFSGYHGCDTPYHDLEHTFQVIKPMVQILDGWNRAKSRPTISSRFYELSVIAGLLHDTGYIRKKDEEGGTGGRYTFVHIGRSIDFTEKYLAGSRFGISDHEIVSVCNMIRCTGILDHVLWFSCDEERICGYALGVADLLGQLSAENYPDKLPALYLEFREAYEYEGLDTLRRKKVLIFESEADLINKTPMFYQGFVKKRFEKLGSLDRYLDFHRPNKNDHYLRAIEKNISRLNSIHREAAV